MDTRHLQCSSIWTKYKPRDHMHNIDKNREHNPKHSTELFATQMHIYVHMWEAYVYICNTWHTKYTHAQNTHAHSPTSTHTHLHFTKHMICKDTRHANTEITDQKSWCRDNLSHIQIYIYIYIYKHTPWYGKTTLTCHDDWDNKLSQWLVGIYKQSF